MAYMPYMNFYIDEFKNNNCEIELLYWKRDNKDDIIAPSGIKTHMFKFEQEDSIPLIKKSKGFLKFRKFASNILKNNRYDLVVVLHSTPGVLLYDLLMKYYKTNYILDYRDFTYENIKLYKKIIHKLVLNSSCTFVSSDAYREYLPRCKKIYTSHNLLTDSLEKRNTFKVKKNLNIPIKIRFWGLIRHKDINIGIIDRLGNDNRFELHYHGREQETAIYLKKYCYENKIRNVFFHGEYRPNERYEFAKDTDILHNMYENDKTMSNAMSNKYYDGIVLYIPQLCTEGSFMGKKVRNNKLGYVLNPYDENLADEIYKFYMSIDKEKFIKSCDEILDEVLDQYNIGIEKISQLVI